MLGAHLMLALLSLISFTISPLCNFLGPLDTPLISIPSLMFKTKSGLTERHRSIFKSSLYVYLNITSICPPGRAWSCCPAYIYDFLIWFLCFGLYSRSLITLPGLSCLLDPLFLPSRTVTQQIHWQTSLIFSAWGF